MKTTVEKIKLVNYHVMVIGSTAPFVKRKFCNGADDQYIHIFPDQNIRITFHFSPQNECDMVFFCAPIVGELIKLSQMMVAKFPHAFFVQSSSSHTQADELSLMPSILLGSKENLCNSIMDSYRFHVSDEVVKRAKTQEVLAGNLLRPMISIICNYAFFQTRQIDLKESTGDGCHCILL